MAPTTEEVPTPTRPLEFSAEAGRCTFQQDRTQDRFTTTMSMDRFTTTTSITSACRPVTYLRHLLCSWWPMNAMICQCSRKGTGHLFMALGA